MFSTCDQYPLEQETLKKDFVNKMDPHNLKRLVQKERCIWFGVHDELLRNKNIIKVLEQCRDQSLPVESAAIHLDKFKVCFSKNNVYVVYDEKYVSFLKLYLITKEQFMDILKIKYHCNKNVDSIKGQIFELGTLNSDVKLTAFQENNSYFYDTVKCVGELDGINILVLTASSAVVEPPDSDILRKIFNGLKKTFHPYSDYLIMYYLYLLEGVKNYFTIKQLTDVFLRGEREGSTDSEQTDLSSETKQTINEIANQNKLLCVQDNNSENIVKNNKKAIKYTITKAKENNNRENKGSIEDININLTPEHNDNKNEMDTVKCSTCNGSPFINTAEKAQLNQYSFIFDLHHLPNFDENTGEFQWKNSDNNFKFLRDSILKSDEGNYKSMNMFHGSIASLSNDFNKEDFGTPDKKYDEKNNSGTFVEELNNILKEIN